MSEFKRGVVVETVDGPVTVYRDGVKVVSTNGKDDFRFHNCGDARQFARALLEVADPMFDARPTATGGVVELDERRPLVGETCAEFVVPITDPAS